MRKPKLTCDEQPCPVPGLVGPCHIPRKKTNKDGYCYVEVNGKTAYAHRYALELEIGPLPPGILSDHICRVRACCNADHLRPVTPKINSTENASGLTWQRNAAKTHCANGHPYDDANTYRTPRNERQCRTCKRAARLRSRRRPV